MIGINTALSAVYYIRVLKVMILDKSLDEIEGREPVRLRLPAPAVAYAGFLAVVVIGLGVAWNFLAVASAEGVKSFARESAPTIEAGRKRQSTCRPRIFVDRGPESRQQRGH